MEQIGRHVYTNLKSKKNLTPEEKKKVDGYEKPAITNNGAIKAYAQKLDAERVYQKPNLDQIWKAFTSTWEIMTSEPIKLEQDVIDNLEPILKYFAGDVSFGESSRVSNLSEPSLDKGLLIIGKNGVGKSQTMKVCSEIFRGTDQYFKFHDCMSLVRVYEELSDASERKEFNHKMRFSIINLDDAKQEDHASNYGKKNLVRDILYDRESRGLKTHMTCNYLEGCQGNVDATMKEYGARYGSALYDRMFKMFNIIEFKAQKSFRR